MRTRSPFLASLGIAALALLASRPQTATAG